MLNSGYFPEFCYLWICLFEYTFSRGYDLIIAKASVKNWLALVMINQILNIPPHVFWSSPSQALAVPFSTPHPVFLGPFCTSPSASKKEKTTDCS